MSEIDLQRALQEQQRIFQELEERQRRQEDRIAFEQLADMLETLGIELTPFVALRKQLIKLGKSAGMHHAEAELWAKDLIVKAIELRIEKAA